MRFAGILAAIAALWAVQPASAATIVIQGKGKLVESDFSFPELGSPYEFTFTLNNVEAPSGSGTTDIDTFVKFPTSSAVGFYANFTFVNRAIQSAGGSGEPADDVCGGGGGFSIVNNLFRMDDVLCVLPPNSGADFYHRIYEGKITRIFINGVATPEPGTWALMILGFGMIGAALRRQHRGVLRMAAR